MKQRQKGRKDRKPLARAVTRARGAPIPEKVRRKGGPQGAGLQKPAWMLSK